MIRDLVLKGTLAMLNPENRAREITLKSGRLVFACNGLTPEESEKLGESWTVFLSLVLGVEGLEVVFIPGVKKC